MWRLRLLSRRARIVIAASAVALLVAAGAVYAVTRGDGKKAASAPTVSIPNYAVFYLQALAPKTEASGCTMKITFRWKPHFRAMEYVGDTAVIQVTGSGISGTYRKPFTRQGVSLGPVSVSLAGGYQIWSARVMSLAGDEPGNNTTIQAAPPASTKCR